MRDPECHTEVPKRLLMACATTLIESQRMDLASERLLAPPTCRRVHCLAGVWAVRCHVGVHAALGAGMHWKKGQAVHQKQGGWDRYFLQLQLEVEMQLLQPELEIQVLQPERAVQVLQLEIQVLQVELAIRILQLELKIQALHPERAVQVLQMEQAV